MLGNSLNPSSSTPSMARKITDTSHEEVETHKMFSNEPNLSTNTKQNNLMGPQLQHRSQKPQKQSVCGLNFYHSKLN